MKRRAENAPDPEDLFADTRMSFGDHLEDLRLHLWRAIQGFLVAMVLSFVIGKPAMYVLIIRPVEQQLDAYYREYKEKHAKQVLDELGKGKDDGANEPRYVDVQFLGQHLKAILAGKDPE